MIEVKRILVGSDLSESAVLAERRAAKLCRRFGLSELEIINVQDTGLTEMLGQILQGQGYKSEDIVREQAEKDFEVVRKRIMDEFGIATRLTIRFGRASLEIAKYARECEASLIVVGTSLGSVGSFFLGNTPDRLLHVSDVPLLIVRQPVENPYQNALIPVDFSANANFAARLAIHFLLPAARKTFLHAYEIPHEGLMRYANVSTEVISEFRKDARRNAEKKMQELIASLDSENRVSEVVQFGDPVNVIEKYMETSPPDLIVMGKAGRSHIEGILLGSTTRHVVNETACDILVVPYGSRVPLEKTG